VTYARKIEKAEAAIDWAEPAEAIERRVRAFDPFPGAHFRLGGEAGKGWRAALAEGRPGEPPGAVLQVDDESLVVACGAGALALRELQRPGGRRLPVREFLAGHTGPLPARLD
jgi:methionyl-tRNA formyltransferase